MELSVEIAGNVLVSIEPVDGVVLVVHSRVELMADGVDLVLLGVNQVSKLVDGNEVSMDLGIEVVDVVFE